MNTCAKIIGLTLISTALFVPSSFADVAKPVPANAVTATAIKMDTKFSIEGNLVGRKGNILTIKDKTGMQFSVDVSKLKNLKGFNTLSIKNGAQIKINCDYSKLTAVADKGYSVNLTTGESATLMNVTTTPAPTANPDNVTIASACVPAQTLAIQMPNPIVLDFVASIEVGKQIFKF